MSSTLCTDGAERSLDRKFREIVYAIELNKDNEKDQILEWYLNQIPYGGQYVGIQAASQGFFHKDAKDLTLGEAALLAGLPQSPTDYHPRTNCVRDVASDELHRSTGFGRTTVGGAAKQRQLDVLNLMVVHGRASADGGRSSKSGRAADICQRQRREGAGVDREPGRADARAHVPGRRVAPAPEYRELHRVRAQRRLDR